MERTELKAWQVLIGNDFMDWEVLHPNLPCAAVWNWIITADSIPMIAPEVPTWVIRSQATYDPFGFLEKWINHAGVVVLVPQRDVKMTLAIRRVDDKFQLLGRRGG